MTDWRNCNRDEKCGPDLNTSHSEQIRASAVPPGAASMISPHGVENDAAVANAPALALDP
jgi:hypothetical protein